MLRQGIDWDLIHMFQGEADWSPAAAPDLCGLGPRRGGTAPPGHVPRSLPPLKCKYHPDLYFFLYSDPGNIFIHNWKVRSNPNFIHFYAMHLGT